MKGPEEIPIAMFDTPAELLDNRHGRRAREAMEQKRLKEENLRLRRRLLAMEERMRKKKHELPE